jgi:hypothetical protein
MGFLGFMEFLQFPSTWAMGILTTHIVQLRNHNFMESWAFQAFRVLRHASQHFWPSNFSDFPDFLGFLGFTDFPAFPAIWVFQPPRISGGKLKEVASRGKLCMGYALFEYFASLNFLS